MQAGKRMQRGGGGEQIWNGRARDSKEAAGGKASREEPLGECGIGIAVQLAQQRDYGRGCGSDTRRGARNVREAAVFGAEVLERCEQPFRLRQCLTKILMGSHRKKCRVRGSMRRPVRLVVSAVRSAKSFDATENRLRGHPA